MDNRSVLLKFEIYSELGPGQDPVASHRAPARAPAPHHCGTRRLCRIPCDFSD